MSTSSACAQETRIVPLFQPPTSQPPEAAFTPSYLMAYCPVRPLLTLDGGALVGAAIGRRHGVPHRVPGERAAQLAEHRSTNAHPHMLL